MPDSPAHDPLAVLDARARPRTRLAVGAAVTLFIVAVAVAAMVSFIGGGGGAQGTVGAQVASGDDASTSASATEDTADGAAVDGSAPVLVHVLGAVAEPGLVELAPGSRVVDAVAAAGGFTAEADPSAVNLARAVADGEQLVVLAIGQVPIGGPASAGSAPGSAGSSDGTVHLNTADLAELDTLPRIGPALAQRIIDWRETNGPFTSVDQLLDVAGIGDAVYSGLVDLVSP
jgi:competence protein ComEA